MKTPPHHPESLYRQTRSRPGFERVESLIAQDLADDLDPHGLDITSWAMLDPQQPGHAEMVAREAGHLAGVNLLWFIAHATTPGPAITVELERIDAQPVKAGDTIAHFRGPLVAILRMERVALNLVNHLSGVASLAAKYVHAVRDTDAVICETRKTLPGLRGLQKYAAACGGATPHRYGLSDAVLIKDNHLAGVPASKLADTITRAAERARQRVENLRFVEVEVDTLEQFRTILACPIDLVLLDNMTNDQLREAIQLRNDHAPHLQLEASGGVNLTTVGDIARTGVNRISVGAITHSAPSLDLGLDINTA